MRFFIRCTGWMLFAVATALALLVAHTIWMRPLKVSWFYERIFAEFAIANPEMMSTLRMLPSWADWYSDDLTDASPLQQQRTADMLADSLNTLRRYDRASMSPSEQVDYDILEYYLSMEDEGRRFQFHNYPINQMGGAQSLLPEFLANKHEIRSSRDVENYLERLDKVPRKFDQLLESARLRESMGIIPPRFVVEKVLQGMREFISVVPENNILYTSFARKLESLPEGGVGNSKFLRRAATSIGDEIYPAYRKLIAYYEYLLPKADGNNGVWALPNGDAFYAWAVRQQTTTAMTPAQIHALGIVEVTRIEAEMDSHLRMLDLRKGSISERMRALGSRPRERYPNSDAGREEILTDYQSIIDEIDSGLSPYFGVRPKARVRVRRMPLFREGTVSGAYYDMPATDGSRPGIFYVNLRDVSEIKKYRMRSLAYHEAIPGHHTQVALQLQKSGVPTFRKVLPFTAFNEGWALYAERLAWEMGYQHRTEDNLGRLQWELFRSVRLVVDTGMHYKKWSREQAIEYMMEKTGMSEADVVAEVERYLVWPGQALSYKVGMNSILEFRERAEVALGPKFKLSRFHDELLTGGAMPLALLSKRVDHWIQEERKR